MKVRDIMHIIWVHTPISIHTQVHAHTYIHTKVAKSEWNYKTQVLWGYNL